MMRLLLHVCCAPCSTHVVSVLREYYDVSLFFFNPCIEPINEYSLRLQNAKKFAKDLCLPLVVGDYDNVVFRNLCQGHEQDEEGGDRCSICFHQRLEKTALLAKNLGFDLFSTTLTVSPYKNADVINKLGKDLELKYDVQFLSSDFKKQKGYLHSIELSKKHNLYRQHYCGCLFSKPL